MEVTDVLPLPDGSGYRPEPLPAVPGTRMTARRTCCAAVRETFSAGPGAGDPVDELPPLS